MEVSETFGVSLCDTYQLALKFYKQNKNEEMLSQVTYADNLKLASFSYQIFYGPFHLCRNPPQFGYFDVVGNDRQNAWKSLYDTSKNDCMRKFIECLDQLCPSFQDFLKENAKDFQKENANKGSGITGIKEEHDPSLPHQPNRDSTEFPDSSSLQFLPVELQEESSLLKIKASLNQQTKDQFENYASLQYPNDPSLRHSLILQLQDQHFSKYIKQVYGVNVLEDQEALNSSQSYNETDKEIDESLIPKMWTMKEIKEFKQKIKSSGAETILTINHGEIVTIRVPTHSSANHLYWEFATDNYDIAFGLYFEWVEPVSDAITVVVSESSSEEEDDDKEESSSPDKSKKDGQTHIDLDVELGHNAETFEHHHHPSPKNETQIDEIIPLYRRDSHLEIYAGKHPYPGRGVYLMKFDNSYSLWRSKCLYYKVYYSSE